MSLVSVKVIKPNKINPDRSAAVFQSKAMTDYGTEVDLYVVHFRVNGKRTRRVSSGELYEYRTRDKQTAISVAADFINYH